MTRGSHRYDVVRMLTEEAARAKLALIVFR